MTDKPTDAATPECLTCSDHGAVGNILTAEPCPDCTRWNVQPAPATQQAGATGECTGPHCMASSANGYAHSRGRIDEAAETQGWTPTADDYAKCVPSAPQPSTTAQAVEAVALDHIAVIEDGELRYMTGRKAPAYDCELYAMPDGKRAPVLFTAPQPVARVPLDEARRLFDAGWKAAALFCDREDVVTDGIIGFGACPQFEAAFSAAHGIRGGQRGTE